MVYQFMSEHRNAYTIREMARIFGSVVAPIISGRRRECPRGGRKPTRNWWT
jgi:hypothetical protein